MQGKDISELELYTRRELTLADARAAAPDFIIEGRDGDGTRISINDRVRPILTLDEASLDVSLDFVDYVKEISGRSELPFCYELEWPAGRRSAPAGDRGLEIAKDLARRCDGVVADFYRRVVWPAGGAAVPDFDDDLYDIPENSFRVVQLRWFVREAVCADPVTAWVRAVGRVVPDWLPTEYTGRARMLALTRASVAAADDIRRTGDYGVHLTGPGPIDTVEILPSVPEEPYGMYDVECAVELGALDEAALDRLHEVLVAVADELGAELALAEVLEGWDRAYSGSVMPGAQAQSPQEVSLGDTALAGLPMRPVPWCYLGPAYARLLSDFLADAPAPWDSRRTARGLALRLSRRPVPADDLPSDWFPADFCMSVQPRWFHESIVQGAVTVPDWS
ncbi:hypothetical protein [Actinomyces israelii]|uniref:hypothetical protein n=1 Tax=Actinomyces israelii TaxID=1659 RepID=UPI002552DD1E|nr:hypothetical protein [Actinomyces israelii]WKR22758.1 hypothetical protein AIF0345_2712 [Actinomyces israelii]